MKNLKKKVKNYTWTMTMNQGTESKTILEAKMEVLYIDILIWCSFALTPQQETFLGCHLLNRDVLNSES